MIQKLFLVEQGEILSMVTINLDFKFIHMQPQNSKESITNFK